MDTDCTSSERTEKPAKRNENEYPGYNTLIEADGYPRRLRDRPANTDSDQCNSNKKTDIEGTGVRNERRNH